MQVTKVRGKSMLPQRNSRNNFQSLDEAPPTRPFLNPSPMTKPISLPVLLLVLCLGCNDAATQQRANQAEQAAVGAELKAQGEATQNVGIDGSTDTGIKDVEP